MNQLSSKQKRFYKEVARILWEEWDPIGVNDGENEWNDEYDSYVPHTFKLAINGADAVKISNSLSSSIIQNMGLASNPQHDLVIAQFIIKAKEEMLG
ncbi:MULTISPECIES: hypothetical protein [unclassified Colwellia]|jgi:hypothetical protein|uniref:hypothetical protein n=1 Tax=unclassified Colwellia TaxID=196834 RepID=UPI0015F5868E|nr:MULTISPECIES: hypothetical protein [unclassified Colwellia]MBA6381298.1 hypothetical protein [Colwellia sp. BRX10-7]MBA6389043.1 hypothetical protein [Colwellia sp. BRX10-2]MBA6403768.1 hypothetical protein [Colwellia sp. BRX10-5]MBA6407650.1 hypothetical protein [Colwellia sp. BRX10-1]